MTKREVFAIDDEFKIYTISDEDRKHYVELHRQLNGESSLYLNPRSKDMMWEQTLKDADNIFSVFTVNGDYCGSMELQYPDSKTPEIGIDLMEDKRNKGIAPKIVRLFAKKVYMIRSIDYFLIRISSNNLHSQHVFEKMGAIKIGEEKNNFLKFVDRFKKIAIKEGCDLEKFRNLFCEDINEVIYRYRLNLDTFLQDTCNSTRPF